MVKRRDLFGQRFGRLVVTRDTGKNNGAKNPRKLWECLCDCGNTTEVITSNLTRGITRSCGCLAKESAIQSIQKNSTVNRFGADSKEFQESKIKATKTYTERYVKEGINLRNLTQKIGKNNNSGVKGVCWDKARSRWLAYIQVQGKVINLGRFLDKDEAIQVRKEAEDKYFKPILEKYTESQ